MIFKGILVVKNSLRPESAPLAIIEKCKSNLCFSFCYVKLDDIYKNLKIWIRLKHLRIWLYPNQIKENTDIFSSFIFKGFSNMKDFATFPIALKSANITSVFKKRSKIFRKIQTFKLLSAIPTK